jgi:hypothetical protein
MVQRTPARVQAEQLGYRKSHFFLRLRQKSQAVETRLLRETGVVDAGSGLTVAGVGVGAGAVAVANDSAAECAADGEGPLVDSRRNLPSWSRNSLLPVLVMMKAARTAFHLSHGVESEQGEECRSER